MEAQSYNEIIGMLENICVLNKQLSDVELVKNQYSGNGTILLAEANGNILLLDVAFPHRVRILKDNDYYLVKITDRSGQEASIYIPASEGKIKLAVPYNIIRYVKNIPLNITYQTTLQNIYAVVVAKIVKKDDTYRTFILKAFLHPQREFDTFLGDVVVSGNLSDSIMVLHGFISIRYIGRRLYLMEYSVLEDLNRIEEELVHSITKGLYGLYLLGYVKNSGFDIEL